MLIKCPECELQLSDKAIICPHCGLPMKQDAALKLTRRSNKRRRLPNGFGQISEIKNRNLRNPFRAMVTVGKALNGRPICKPLKPQAFFPTYNDAYEALMSFHKNPYEPDKNITLQELYERWTDKYFPTINEQSRKGIRATWKYCVPMYGMNIQDLRSHHIKDIMETGFVMKGDKQITTNSVTKNRIKSLFNVMLDYAVEYEIIEKNWSRAFKLGEGVIKDTNTAKKEHIDFTEEEIDKLWANLGKYKYIDLILIQCYSGWRPQELLLLELENIDLENWTFKGGMKTEAGKDRIVPIHSKIQPLVLAAYEQAKNDGQKRLFYLKAKNGDIRELQYYTYKKNFDKMLKELELNENHRPHDGRKHFVTQAKKYGVDEYAIKYIVGHNISDITEKVYTNREFKWLKEEIEKIQ